MLVKIPAVFFFASCIARVQGDSYKFKFIPINGSAADAEWTPTAPWKIPAGFKQRVISNETNLNIYGGGRNDWNDMNTVNEMGRYAGQFLYRTHEVRGEPEGGAVSVVNLKTKETSVLAQDKTWTALDGIRWSPWNTILFAEETDNGRFFEIVLNRDMVTGTVYDRPAVGRLAHEGIATDRSGNVYCVDEFRGEVEGYGGGIYKFVPTRFGDLTSGNLYVLKVVGNLDGTGQGEWVGPIDPATARVSGTAAGGTGYNRPEDLQIINNVLYAAITEGPRNGGPSEEYDGRVLAINLLTMSVTNFVKPGVNVPVEIGFPGSPGFQTGFDNPDNLAMAPDGRLVIIEDNVPSDIWFAEDTNGDGVADKVELFASLSDYGAEGTGIYFSPFDPKTLYVNIQHSKIPDGDGTWAISKIAKKKRFRSGYEDEDYED